MHYREPSGKGAKKTIPENWGESINTRALMRKSGQGKKNLRNSGGSKALKVGAPQPTKKFRGGIIKIYITRGVYSPTGEK